jgi:hypothetical protein
MAGKIAYVGAWRNGGETLIEVWNGGVTVIFSTHGGMSQKDQDKLKEILSGQKEM